MIYVEPLDIYKVEALDIYNFEAKLVHTIVISTNSILVVIYFNIDNIMPTKLKENLHVKFSIAWMAANQ